MLSIWSQYSRAESREVHISLIRDPAGALHGTAWQPLSGLLQLQAWLSLHPPQTPPSSSPAHGPKRLWTASQTQPAEPCIPNEHHPASSNIMSVRGEFSTVGHFPAEVQRECTRQVCVCCWTQAGFLIAAACSWNLCAFSDPAS